MNLNLAALSQVKRRQAQAENAVAEFVQYSRRWLEDNPQWRPSFNLETEAPQEGLDGGGSTEVEAKPTPHVWSDPAVLIALRSSEDAVARVKLEDHYVHVEVPNTGDRKKPFVQLALTWRKALLTC